MTMSTDFAEAFARCSLIAILRGVRPDEVIRIGNALADAGFSIIEIPLNSPNALESIERLAEHLADRCLIGAGTVLTRDQVQSVRLAGGRIIVSPNSDRAVIAAARDAGLDAVPGYFTPTEAFGAIEAGASALKLFPAEAASPAVLRAHRAVLPNAIPVVAVGGITPEAMAQWSLAGASGFGLGSSLYRPGTTCGEVRDAAGRFVETRRAYTVGASA